MERMSAEKRRKVMRSIRGKNTRPEMIVRRSAHALGYRYRVHGVKLPGRPDLVFSRRRKVVFVHGCFWHQHEGCKLAKVPKSNLEYWLPKLERNRLRDARAQADLRGLGWQLLVIWECEVDDQKLAERLREFLS
jgi:DNA mismatch endonuclease, patch repair protein